MKSVTLLAAKAAGDAVSTAVSRGIHAAVGPCIQILRSFISNDMESTIKAEDPGFRV